MGVVVTYRMSDQDTVIARRQHAMGALSTQIAWLYDRPVDVLRLAEFHAGLCRGRLGRVAARASIGAAGDRWTGHAEFQSLDVATTPLRRKRVNQWLADRADDNLDAYGGPAWRLAYTPLAEGGGVVSLVVCRAVADGMSLFTAIAEAVTGTARPWVFAADQYPRGRLVFADLLAAVRRLAGTLAVGTVLLVAAMRRSHSRRRADTSHSATGPVVGASTVTRAVACVPARQWHASAKARRGTGTTLMVAMMAALAVELGRVDAEGTVWMEMPLSTRAGAADAQANATTTVRFDVDNDAVDRSAGNLALLRATMKRAFGAAREATVRQRRIWRLYLAIPRPVSAWLLRLRHGPDFVTTYCSVIDELDAAVSRIDGAPATSVAMGAFRPRANEHQPNSTSGGTLRGSKLEVNGEVTLRLACMNSPNCLTRSELQELIRKVLDRYDLAPSFW